MANKNDKKDLWQFLAVALAAVCGLVWLAGFCCAKVEKNYGSQIRRADAAISEFVREKIKI